MSYAMAHLPHIQYPWFPHHQGQCLSSLFQQSVLAKRGTDFPIQVNGKFVEIRHIKGTLSSSQPPPSPVALLLGSEYQMQDVVLLAVACQAR